MTLTLATVLAEERVCWGGSCLQKLPCVTRGRGGLLGGLHPPILGTPTSAPCPGMAARTTGEVLPSPGWLCLEFYLVSRL